MPATEIRDGYNSVTPYLSLKGAADAIEFYKKAFGAEERFRLPMPDGSIGHAELMVGGSRIMLADGCGEEGFKDPTALAGTSIALYLYVEDVDATYDQAIAAGAETVKPVEDQFYGDRTGTLRDPYGHLWFIATHKEDLTAEEVDKRAKELFGGA